MKRDVTGESRAVAIIGMAGRFPDAPDLESFWRNLASGYESLRVFSDAELEAVGIPPSVYRDPRFVRAGTILDGADLFDAAFFGISPREAEILDPQHRLFLECAWEALENAGLSPRQQTGVVGVFAGASMNTYQHAIIARNPALAAEVGGYQLMLGNDKDFLPTRVSYKLNLRGPSLNVQTACSTSLVAVQVAYDSLVRRQCDVALAGGVSVYFPQGTGYLYQEGMIFSPDGHCRPFDARGQGIRAGGGVGAVVLKRLTDAIADGDPIRAVILGAAINNDGANKVGYTAPSVDGQAEAIATAQVLAQIDASTVSYIEAHGTGTPLGDPIEIAALRQVFDSAGARPSSCALGSVKSNIGHLDAAAGIAGLIKAVLALEHRQLPPSLNFEVPNPQIDFEGGPFFVNSKLRAWESDGVPLRAGVSSFGIGGTNAHVVLEEAPRLPETPDAARAQVLVLSARSPAALAMASDRLADSLEKSPALGLRNVAYTLQVGREHMPARRAIVCRDAAEAIAALRGTGAARALSGSFDKARPMPVTFMFSGQGNQYPGMARELYACCAAFRDTLDECAERLAPLIGTDIRSLLCSVRDAPELAAQLEQTAMAQPALFSLELALARTWMRLGVQPDALIGHSIGEYVAACVAEVFSLEDALQVVAARGRLMQRLPHGAMVSVAMAEADLSRMLEPGVSIAAVNGPTMCVAAGPTNLVDALMTALSSRGVDHRRLHTSHAFHSEMMQPALQPFQEVVQGVRRSRPRIPFMSNVSGTWITAEQAVDPAYWAAHLRSTVRFSQSLEAMARADARVLLEVGPGNSLATLARQILGPAGRHAVIESLPHARDRRDAEVSFKEAVARLWLLGADIGWPELHAPHAPRRTHLPSYPFQRERYWVEPAPLPGAMALTSDLSKRAAVESWFYGPTWIRSSALASEPNEQPGEGGIWLLFGDGLGLQTAIDRTLRNRGCATIRVIEAAEFRETAEGDFELDHRNPAHHTRLAAALLQSSRVPSRVLFLMGVTTPRRTEPPCAAYERGLDRDYMMLAHWITALSQSTVGPIHHTVVTSNLHAVVAADEVIHPEKALLSGPAMVAPQEVTALTFRSVDLDARDVSEDTLDGYARILIAEATQNGPPECAAYRAGRRWLRGFESLPVANSAPLRPFASEGATYLITGGSGGLGLVFARELARQARVKIVLISRTAAPPRENWDAILGEAKPRENVVRLIRAMRDIEQSGSQVELVAADVADLAAMHRAVEGARARWGEVKGVIHAAGIAGGRIIARQDKATVRQTLDAKVLGALVLTEVFRDTPLDFFVLCSSKNAIYAGPGGADYASANAFLDALAVHLTCHGQPRAVSINWDTWQEVGMAVDTAVPRDLEAAKQQNLRDGMSNAEGVRALTIALSLGQPQVVASTKDLFAVLHVLRAMAASTKAAALQESSSPSMTADAARPAGALHTRPDLSTAYVSPRSEPERRLEAIWSSLLGLESIGIHDNFFELGGHSLLATRILSRITEAFGVSLPLQSIFESPTIAELSERLETMQWLATESRKTAPVDSEREEFEI